MTTSDTGGISGLIITGLPPRVTEKDEELCADLVEPFHAIGEKTEVKDIGVAHRSPRTTKKAARRCSITNM